MFKNGLLHFYLFFFRIIVWKKAGKEIYSLFCSVKNNDARAVFTWMSKVIRIRFGFAFRHFLCCTETLAPLAIACPIRGKANQSWLAHARFPALHADHVVTLRFDWFTRLPVSFVTGYFVLVLTLNWKFLFALLLVRASFASLLFLTTYVIFTGKPQTSVLLN